MAHPDGGGQPGLDGLRGGALPGLDGLCGGALPGLDGRRGGARGSATAELAMGLPALLVLLLVGLTAVGAATTQLRCVDAAREAALAAARGESGVEAGYQLAPSNADVTVTISGATVVATVQAPVPVLGARLPALSVDATAVAAVEPGLPGLHP